MSHLPSSRIAARWLALIFCSLTASFATGQVGTECMVTVAGQLQQYRACFKVPHTGKEFYVYFSLDPAPSDPSGSSILSMALSTESPGYVSVGFPTNGRDSMVASYAAILQDCSTCANSAKLEWYWMSGYDMENVVPSNTGNVSATAVAAKSNGLLAGSFTVDLPGVGVNGSVSNAYDTLGGGQRRRLLDGDDTGGRVDGAYTAWSAADYPLLFVYGWVKNGDELTVHKDTATGSVDLTRGAPGATNGGSFSVGVSSDSGLQAAHAWITTIAWGVIIPLGLFMPRYFKTRLAQDARWFTFHKWIAAGGFVLALIGVILGFAASESFTEFGKSVHRDLGLAATVLGLVQCFALIKRLRPAPDHRYRRYWFWFHAWTGRSATILAIANIYYGIIEVEALGAWAWATYTAVLGVIVLAGVTMEVNDFKARKNDAVGPQKDPEKAVEDGDAPLKPADEVSHEAAEIDLPQMER